MRLRIWLRSQLKRFPDQPLISYVTLDEPYPSKDSTVLTCERGNYNFVAIYITGEDTECKSLSI